MYIDLSRTRSLSMSSNGFRSATRASLFCLRSIFSSAASCSSDFNSVIWFPRRFTIANLCILSGIPRVDESWLKDRFSDFKLESLESASVGISVKRLKDKSSEERSARFSKHQPDSFEILFPVKERCLRSRQQLGSCDIERFWASAKSKLPSAERGSETDEFAFAEFSAATSGSAGFLDVSLKKELERAERLCLDGAG